MVKHDLRTQAAAEKQTARVERKEIRKAAGHIREASGQIAQSTDRATQLAADRTMFAAERTYAAWVRTGLAAMASGIAAKAVLKGVLPDLGIRLAGSVLILFSAFCFGAAIWRQLFKTMPPPEATRIPGAILYGVNGALALVALFALFSIWLSH